MWMPVAANAKATDGGRRKAFTLIELLVVIAIITVLMTILAPSLRRVRDIVKRVVCGADMHQLAIGWSAYVQDNNGCLVGSATYRDFDWVRHYDALGNWIPDPIGAGKLLPYVPSRQVFKCTNPIVPEYPVSYSLTGPLNGEAYNVWRRGIGIKSHYATINQVKYPNMILAFVEEFDGRGCNSGAFVLETHDSWADYVAANHYRGDNLAFADGRVEYWSWFDQTTFDPPSLWPTGHGYSGLPAVGSKDLDRLWNAYCGMAPDLPISGGLAPCP